MPVISAVIQTIELQQHPGLIWIQMLESRAIHHPYIKPNVLLVLDAPTGRSGSSSGLSVRLTAHVGPPLERETAVGKWFRSISRPLNKGAIRPHWRNKAASWHCARQTAGVRSQPS